MNSKSKKNLIVIIGCIIGIIIMLIPTLITGNSFSNSTAIGGLHISEFIMRVVSYIVGLLVIYDSIKTFNKSID